MPALGQYDQDTDQQWHPKSNTHWIQDTHKISEKIQSLLYKNLVNVQRPKTGQHQIEIAVNKMELTNFIILNRILTSESLLPARHWLQACVQATTNDDMSDLDLE